MSDFYVGKSIYIEHNKFIDLWIFVVYVALDFIFLRDSKSMKEFFNRKFSFLKKYKLKRIKKFNEKSKKFLDKIKIAKSFAFSLQSIAVLSYLIIIPPNCKN